MAEQLFNTDLGYRIEDEDGNSVDIILVDGLPGTSAESIAAEIGSLALSTNGGQYRKKTVGSGTDKWESTSSSQAVVDLQTEVDGLETALGSIVDANGDYVAFSGTNYIDANADLTEDLSDLDDAIAAVATEVTSTQAALGGMVDANGDYVAHTGTNFIDGNSDVTEDITDLDTAVQAVSDASVQKAGSTMDLNANITFNGGEILGLPATPSGPTAATSQAYVDALVASGTTWRDPIVDPNVVDVVGTEPVAPVAEDAYIVSAGGTWTGSVAVVAGDLVYWSGTAWVVVENLQIGDRFIVSGETATTAGAGITGMGFADNALLEVVATGAWLTAGSYSEPDGTAGVDMPNGITVLAGDPQGDHYGHTYFYDDSVNSWIEISGPGAVGAGTGLSYAGTVLNINMGAGIVESPSDEVGLDLHANGGLQTTVDGSTGDTGSASQLAVKLADSTLTLGAAGLSVDSSITAPITNLVTTLGSAVNAQGVYQAFSGTTYIDGNASLAADLIDLDTAIDAVATSAGNVQTEVDNIEAAMGAMVDASGNYVAFSGSNYLDAAADVTAALTALDNQVDANATASGNNTSAISTLSNELTAIELGAGLDTDGTYLGHTGSNYLDTATSLHNADVLLDQAIDGLSNLAATNGFELNYIRSFIGKGAGGSEDPFYASDLNVTQNADLETAIGDLDAALGDLSIDGVFTVGGETAAEQIESLDVKLDEAHHELVNLSSGAGWTTIDTLATASVLFAKWLVHIRLGTNVVTWEVDAIHDGGDAGSPVATKVDFTRFAKLKLGSIAGVKIQVVLVGTNMVLQVQDSAGTAIVNSVREIILDQ